MAINFLHVAEGWAKSLGLWDASEEMKKLSQERLAICAVCEFASESSFLKLARGECNEVLALVCSKCPSKIKCPVNEKTLVKVSTCPENKW